MRIIALIITLSVTPATAGWFGPDNYDDCILENIKPGLSKQGAYAVKNSCRSKFSYSSGHGALTFGNPDDCILEHVKPEMLGMSVSLIRKACNSKYNKPKKTKKSSDLDEFRKTYVNKKEKPTIVPNKIIYFNGTPLYVHDPRVK